MKILETNPPNIAEIIKVFPEVKGDKMVIFAYGDTIYAPGGKEGISPDREVHEKVHEKQQKELGWHGPRRWWKKYLEDPEFRLDQELEAYRAQYAFVKQHQKDRNKLHKFLMEISGHLAHPMYGNLVTKEQARELIEVT